MRDYIQNYIASSIAVKKQILENDLIISEIERIVIAICEAFKLGGKILTAGNGGSAADAQHIAAEFVSKFLFERPAMHAMALTTNTSILTSIGNDYEHELVFARQIQAVGNKGDIFIAISTSGNSKNIVRAVDEANKKGLIVVGLLGGKKSLLDDKCDYVIKVPSEFTPNIQEAHIMIAHLICAMVEKELN